MSGVGKIFLIILIGCAHGICAAASEDSGQNSKDASIIDRVTFDSYQNHEKYGTSDLRHDFRTRLSIGTFWPFQRTTIDSLDPFHRQVLKVEYPAEKVRSIRSGASWKWKTFYPRQNLYLSYWVLFPDSFVFRHGGKLHGLLGGKGNTGGKKPDGKDGWSARIHWGIDDRIKLYIYHKDQDRDFGDTFYFTHPAVPIDIRKPETEKRNQKNEIHIETGIWHHIQLRVKVNALGYRNGLVQAWYDGKRVADVRGLEFRDASCDPEDLLSNAAYFSTFFGGRSEEYKPVKDETVFFDDFIISKDLVIPEGMSYEKGETD